MSNATGGRNSEVRGGDAGNASTATTSVDNTQNQTAVATGSVTMPTSGRPVTETNPNIPNNNPPQLPFSPSQAPVSPSGSPPRGPGAGRPAPGNRQGGSLLGGLDSPTGANRFHLSEAVRNARQTVAAAAGRGPRRARLQLKKVDPWSVMKFSFAASIVLFFAFLVATALLYTVLDAIGVFDSINETVKSLTSSEGDSDSTGGIVIDAKLVIGGAALLGAVNMVLFTALTTLGAFVYNICADLAGGIEVTLAERD